MRASVGLSALTFRGEPIAEVLQGRDRLLFIALAASDPDRYTRLMRESRARMRSQLPGAKARPDSSESASSWKTTTSPCWACATARGSGSVPSLPPGRRWARGTHRIRHLRAAENVPVTFDAGDPASQGLHGPANWQPSR